MPTSGRGFATRKSNCTPNDCAEALTLMERALDIIDHQDGPADVGAHLDLAIARLRNWVDAQRG